MVAVILRIGGAAIDAAEVAAVRDRNTQVSDLPAEFVVKGHGTYFWLARPPEFLLSAPAKTKRPDPAAWNRAQRKYTDFR
jgi:hypothetical protein